MKDNNKTSKIVLGIIFIIIGINLIKGSAGTRIRTSEGVNEISDNISTIDINGANDDKNNQMVYASGEIKYEQPLVDSYTGFSMNVVAAERTTEIYQWYYNCEDKESDCKYEKVWVDHAIDSSSYDKDHQNKKIDAPLGTIRLYNGYVKLGKYSLSSELFRLVALNKNAEIKQSVEEEFRKKGSYLANYHGNASIGDIRVSYETKDFSTVSLLAKLENEKLTPYEAKSGEKIFTITEGESSVETLLGNIGRRESFSNVLMIVLGMLPIGIGVLAFLDAFGVGKKKEK